MKPNVKYIKTYMLSVILVLSLLLAVLPAQAGDQVQVDSNTLKTPVTIELKSADIRDVLQLMAKMSGINVVADQSVSGAVSVSLKDVPFNHALDLVVKANGFNYLWVGDTLLVASEERMARTLEEPVLQTFRLQYLDPSEAVAATSLIIDKTNIVADKGSKTLVVKAVPSQLATVAKLIESLDVAMASEPELAGPIATGTSTMTALSPQSGSGIKIINLNYASSEAAVQALGLVLPEEAIRVIQKDRSVAIRGTDHQIAECLQILREVDRPAYQVLIEARIEEIEVTALKNLGIDWSAVVDGLTLSQNIGGSLTDFKENNFSLAKTSPDIEATLKILEESGDSTVLANPRVAVLDGEKATIHIGDRVPIVIESKDADGNAAYMVEYIDVGIMLEVQPRITSEGFITTMVKPEVSTITGQTDQGYPQIRTRKADTRMTLTNGETMVIGGLIQEEVVDRVRKVPILGEVPLLGSLFTTKTKDKSQTEIVIFLTPTIIPIPSY